VVLRHCPWDGRFQRLVKPHNNPSSGKTRGSCLPERHDNLQQLLESGDSFDVAGPAVKRRTRDRSDLICLTIEAKRKLHGSVVHMVVPPKSASVVRHPKLSLIKAVARGRSCYERVLDGRNPGLGSLARHVKLEPRYVRKVLSFAFLAPDIVESILDGRPPLNLDFAKLYSNIPLSWCEQRRRFGFPACRESPIKLPCKPAIRELEFPDTP
jgi:hypothetical protein